MCSDTYRRSALLSPVFSQCWVYLHMQITGLQNKDKSVLSTHQGIFFGVPATGKTIAVQALNFYRLVNATNAPEQRLSLVQVVQAYR